MTRRATAQDVADLAGVSRSAVSLVLNGRAEGNISRAKQEAVRDAARQLRYTPDAVALSLRSKRTATLGVLTWSDQRGMPFALLHALHAAASGAGYLLMMVDVVERPLQVGTLVDRRVDGFVVVAPELSDFAVPEAVSGLPTVLVNCVDASLAVPSLVPDEVGAGESAARRLVEAGHREIAVLAGTRSLASQQRVQGVRAAVQSAGLHPLAVVAAGHTAVEGYRATRRLLESDTAPSAVVCTHEQLSLGALLAVADLGLDVPGDLSVVSLDDGEDLAGRLVPAVDLVARPVDVIAAHALALLVDELRRGRPAPRQLSFVCPLRPGASVAPPRLRVLPTG